VAITSDLRAIEIEPGRATYSHHQQPSRRRYHQVSADFDLQNDGSLEALRDSVLSLPPVSSFSEQIGESSKRRAPLHPRCPPLVRDENNEPYKFSRESTPEHAHDHVH
jgi:hypothetical protein